MNAAWPRWAFGEEVRCLSLDGPLTPVLESWMASDHRDQIRLRAYLDALVAALGPLPAAGSLALELEVAVAPQHLLHHHDLENYLTPIARRLGAEQFVHVRAKKRAGGDSRLRVGTARLAGDEDLAGWSHCDCAVRVGAQTKAFKERVRAAVGAVAKEPLPAGPVAVELAWRCAPPPRRNWLWLWKPTGDAMGPALGQPHPGRPFYPNDDRIVSLQLHRVDDPSIGHGVDCALWWRMEPESRPELRATREAAMSANGGHDG